MCDLMFSILLWFLIASFRSPWTYWTEYVPLNFWINYLVLFVSWFTGFLHFKFQYLKVYICCQNDYQLKLILVKFSSLASWSCTRILESQCGEEVITLGSNFFKGLVTCSWLDTSIGIWHHFSIMLCSVHGSRSYRRGCWGVYPCLLPISASHI